MTARLLPAGSLLAALVVAGCADRAPLPLDPAEGSDPLAARSPAPEPASLAGPLFGLAVAPNGTLLLAQTPEGIAELRGGEVEAVAALGGVTGVAAIGRGNVLAITGQGFGPPELQEKAFRVSHGTVREIADLSAFEAAVNPDASYNPTPDSNPFDIVHLRGGTALVADAAGNDVLVLRENGGVDWMAVLTPQPNPTDVGPPTIQPVATSVAVGPDGAAYAGELTGFPSPPAMSRVWRIEPGSMHVTCPSAECTEVASGFTSIVDMTFGPDGTLYVVELDEAGWLAVEMAGGVAVAGGTVNACDPGTGACSVVAGGLSLPTAIAVTDGGEVWIAENDALFGTAHVHPLP